MIYYYTMDESIQFFSYITSLTQAKKDETNIEGNIRTVKDLIISNAKKQIELVALSGRTSAVIFGYEKFAKYNGIPLHKYIFPTQEFEGIIRSRMLRTVRECVNEAMFPFTMTFVEYPLEGTMYVLISAEWSDV